MQLAQSQNPKIFTPAVLKAPPALQKTTGPVDVSNYAESLWQNSLTNYADTDLSFAKTVSGAGLSLRNQLAAKLRMKKVLTPQTWLDFVRHDEFMMSMVLSPIIGAYVVGVVGIVSVYAFGEYGPSPLVLTAYAALFFSSTVVCHCWSLFPLLARRREHNAKTVGKETELAAVNAEIAQLNSWREPAHVRRELIQHAHLREGFFKFTGSAEIPTPQESTPGESS